MGGRRITDNSGFECTQQNISSWLYSNKGVPKNAAKHLKDLFPEIDLEKLLFPPEFQIEMGSASLKKIIVAVL